MSEPEVRDRWSLFGVLELPDVRRIWISQVLSEIGDWAARIALAVLVYDRTNSATLTAIVTAVSLIPWIGAGQALSTLADRYPRRSVMIVADLLRGGLFLVLVLPLPVWLLLTVAFLAGLATPPFESARAALLPELLPRKRYGDAVTLSQLTAQAALMLGYLVGGGLVALLTPPGALAVNATSFLASGLVLLRLNGGRVPAAKDRGRVGPRLAEAAGVIFGDTLLRRAVLLAAIPSSCAIAGEALVAVYERQEVGQGDAVIGVLAAAVPAGTMIAAVLLPRKGDHRRLLRAAAGLGLIGSLAAAVSFFPGPSLPLAFVPFLAIGAIFAMAIPANTVGGIRLPGEVRASAFGLIQGLVTGGQALGALAGGALAYYMGAARASAVTLIPAALYCGFALLSVPEMRRQAVPIEPLAERRQAALEAGSFPVRLHPPA